MGVQISPRAQRNNSKKPTLSVFCCILFVYFMTPFLFLILQLFFVIIFFLFFLLMCFWVWSGFTSKSLFISLPKSTFLDINKTLAISKGNYLYHLGCGSGRFLFYLADRHPESFFVGIENSLFLYTLARIRLWLYTRKTGKHNVRIVQGDFMKQSLSQATHIFVYIYPNYMDDLLLKSENVFREGTRLVSASFRFTQKKPVLEVDLHRKSFQLVRKLFVYEF